MGDYYDDYYYYDDDYDEMVEPLPPMKPKLPAFQPISPKKPYQASKPIRKSPPKSENFSKWAQNEKIQRISPPKMSKMPAGKRPSSSNYSLREDCKITGLKITEFTTSKNKNHIG